jgi:hypothetical protein
VSSSRCEPPLETRLDAHIVKRASYAIDVIRRLSEDVRCREQLIWQHGLLDRLPAEVASPIVACATDNDGCTLLMCDVEGLLQRLERWRPEGLYQLNLDVVLTRSDGHP